MQEDDNIKYGRQYKRWTGRGLYEFTVNAGQRCCTHIKPTYKAEQKISKTAWFYVCKVRAHDEQNCLVLFL